MKFAGILLLGTVAYGSVWWNWKQATDSTDATFAADLKSAAEQCAALVSPEDHEAMVNTGKIQREEYDRLLKPLVAFHLNHPEIAHIYTAIATGSTEKKTYVTMLDTAPVIAKSAGQHQWTYTPKGDNPIEKIAPDEKMMEALKTGLPQTCVDKPNRHDFGADAAYYQPLGYNGHTIGVMAVTMNAQIKTDHRAAAQQNALINGGVATLFLLILAFTGGSSKAALAKEKNLRSRLETQFRTLTDRIPGAVFMFVTTRNRDSGELIFISTGIQQFRGISAKDAEAQWHDLKDILPEEFRQENEQRITAAKTDSRPWETAFEQNGRWIQIAASPQRQDDQVLWFGTLLDITNRKKDEEKLAAANEVLHQISQAPDAKTTMDGICEFGADTEKGCVIHWVSGNKIRAVAGSGVPEDVAIALAQERTLRKSEGAAASCSLGKGPLHIVALKDSSFYRSAPELRNTLVENGFESGTCYPIFSGETLLGAIEFLHKTTIYEGESTAKEIQTVRLVETALERMHRIQVLQENERRYQTLFESSPVGICELDETGAVVFSTAAYKQNLSEEAKQKVEASGEDRTEISDQGKTFLAESRAIQKSSGKTHRIVFLYDISEQKTEVVHARHSQEAAEVANLEKSKFLAVMSHEIRTPLNGVIGFAQLLENRTLSDADHQNVVRIRQCGETLLATINDILDLSKIEAGKMEIEIRPFDPQKRLEMCRDILMPRALEKGIKLELETSGLHPIQSDETRFHQILTNLIGNAVKFTERGKVRIKVGLKKERMEVQIIDTGIGITPEQQQKLFQPFSQADASTTRRFGGTGLGLVISKKLCELLGGTIGLESEAGKGTTFKFWIPAPAGEMPAVRIEAPIAQDLLPLNILVAEDDENNRILMAQLLKGMGHTAEFAVNGKEAVRRAQELAQWADLILMDMRMPEMDGVEATETILANGLKHCPIIALTANAMQVDRDRCMAAGMDAYLSKPIELPALQKILRRCQAEKREKLKQTDKEIPVKQPPVKPVDPPSEVPETPIKAPVKTSPKKPEVWEVGDEGTDEDVDTNTNTDADTDTDADVDVDTDDTDTTDANTQADTDSGTDSITSSIIETVPDTAPLLPNEPTSRKSPQPVKDDGPSSPPSWSGAWDEVGTDDSDSEEILNQEALDGILSYIPQATVFALVSKMKETTRRNAALIADPNHPAQEKANAAHAMIGAVGTLGCVGVSVLAQRLETHYRESETIHPEAADLPILVEKTIELLEKALAKT